MNKVNIIGSIFDLSGYSCHTKNLAKALNEIGMDVRLDVSKPPQWERFASDFQLNSITKKFDPNCVSIAICQPPSWPIALAEKPDKFFGYAIFEGNFCPKFWLKYMEDPRVDKILVASKHNRDLILNTTNDRSIINKIEIIPHGVDMSVFYPDKKEENKVFTFIANKGFCHGLHDRGGLQFLFQAFTAEFSDKDNICLKVKINGAYNNPGFDLRKEVDALGCNVKNRAPLFFVTENIDESALRKFYNEGDVFVNTSMADAYNLACVEALACGLPVISTNYGGMTDFVDNENGWLIEKGELGHWSNELLYEDIQWMKPDVKEIRKVMRKVYEDHKEVKRKSKNALKSASNHTWMQTAKKLKAIIEK